MGKQKGCVAIVKAVIVGKYVAVQIEYASKTLSASTIRLTGVLMAGLLKSAMENGQKLGLTTEETMKLLDDGGKKFN